MNRTIIAIVAVVILAAGGYYFWSQQGQPAQTEIANAPTEGQASDIDTSGVLEMSIGNPDAAVTVVEYASYTCPHCRNFHAGPFKQLKADYIDTGKINFVYREVYFDRPGLWAGMVARCGGPERFFGIVDIIYEQQAVWSRAGDPALIAQELSKIGRTAGLDAETIDACLRDADKAEAMVALYEKNAAADNINSTPSFVINGQNHANMSYADFKAIIDEELGGS